MGVTAITRGVTTITKVVTTLMDVVTTIRTHIIITNSTKFLQKGPDRGKGILIPKFFISNYWPSRELAEYWDTSALVHE